MAITLGTTFEGDFYVNYPKIKFLERLGLDISVWLLQKPQSI